jgi:serpin B
MNISRDLTSLEKALVEADVAFGLNLFQEIVQSEPDKNVFISPLSVAMALGMTLNGAAGTTEEAMRRTLEFGDMIQDDINASFQSLMALLMSLDPEVRFDIANSIWYRLEFHVEQDFIDVNRTYFDAEVRELDFSLPEAPGIINAWVDDKTQGKIEEIIDQIDPLVVMFLINAIYFKGTWTYEFDEELTQDDLFTTAEGSQVSCRMMKQESEFMYFETEDFQAVDLPYGDGKFSMTILLPKSGVHVDALVDRLTPEKWTSWTGSFSKTEGIVQLPKFRIEYEKSLVDVLTAMGMGVAFNAGQADFSRINSIEQLFISEVLHKTFVDVDEKGTEAAAVTVVVVELTGVGGSGFVMRVDRPFVFVIRERQSNALCFMGKIVEPTINQ